MSAREEYRERTAREMALAGNHWDAIQKHLDAYEAAVAHELAEKIRQAPFEPHLLQRHQRYRAARIIDPQADRE